MYIRVFSSEFLLEWVFSRSFCHLWSWEIPNQNMIRVIFDVYLLYLVFYLEIGKSIIEIETKKYRSFIWYHIGLYNWCPSIVRFWANVITYVLTLARKWTIDGRQLYRWINYTDRTFLYWQFWRQFHYCFHVRRAQGCQHKDIGLYVKSL